ncbi:flavin reductase family protein [Rhodoligotrophos ferricapiens]|uniref:flavin reductase family protein n=1 Tax=Rhodoligotrophos ferricapiens TaxID=3069264 RepID=UPI00315DA40E
MSSADQGYHCDPEHFRSAMRYFPASVCVITTGTAPNRSGLTATAVCSLSMAPPRILVCLNAETTTCKAIQANTRFAVNVLSQNHIELARCFGGIGQAPAGEQRFSQGCWRDGAFGVPVLDDALHVLECGLIRCHEAGTHNILVGQVLHVPKQGQHEALLYRNGTFGSWAPL